MDLYDISIEELDERIQANRERAARAARDCCGVGMNDLNEQWFLMEQVRHERTGVDPAPYRMSRR